MKVKIHFEMTTQIPQAGLSRYAIGKNLLIAKHEKDIRRRFSSGPSGGNIAFDLFYNNDVDHKPLIPRAPTLLVPSIKQVREYDRTKFFQVTATEYGHVPQLRMRTTTDIRLFHPDGMLEQPIRFVGLTSTILNTMNIQITQSDLHDVALALFKYHIDPRQYGRELYKTINEARGNNAYGGQLGYLAGVYMKLSQVSNVTSFSHITEPKMEVDEKKYEDEVKNDRYEDVIQDIMSELGMVAPEHMDVEPDGKFDPEAEIFSGLDASGNPVMSYAQAAQYILGTTTLDDNLADTSAYVDAENEARGLEDAIFAAHALDTSSKTYNEILSSWVYIADSEDAINNLYDLDSHSADYKANFTDVKARVDVHNVELAKKISTIQSASIEDKREYAKALFMMATRMGAFTIGNTDINLLDRQLPGIRTNFNPEDAMAQLSSLYHDHGIDNMFSSSSSLLPKDFEDIMFLKLFSIEPGAMSFEAMQEKLSNAQVPLKTQLRILVNMGNRIPNVIQKKLFMDHMVYQYSEDLKNEANKVRLRNMSKTASVAATSVAATSSSIVGANEFKSLKRATQVDYGKQGTRFDSFLKKVNISPADLINRGIDAESAVVAFESIQKILDPIYNEILTNLDPSQQLEAFKTFIMNLHDGLQSSTQAQVMIEAKTLRITQEAFAEMQMFLMIQRNEYQSFIDAIHDVRDETQKMFGRNTMISINKLLTSPIFKAWENEQRRLSRLDLKEHLQAQTTQTTGSIAHFAGKVTSAYVDETKAHQANQEQLAAILLKYQEQLSIQTERLDSISGSIAAANDEITSSMQTTLDARFTAVDEKITIASNEFASINSTIDTLHKEISAFSSKLDGDTLLTEEEDAKAVDNELLAELKHKLELHERERESQRHTIDELEKERNMYKQKLDDESTLQQSIDRQDLMANIADIKEKITGIEGQIKENSDKMKGYKAINAKIFREIRTLNNSAKKFFEDQNNLVERVLSTSAENYSHLLHQLKLDNAANVARVGQQMIEEYASTKRVIDSRIQQTVSEFEEAKRILGTIQTQPQEVAANSMLVDRISIPRQSFIVMKEKLLEGIRHTVADIRQAYSGFHSREYKADETTPLLAATVGALISMYSYYNEKLINVNLALDIQGESIEAYTEFQEREIKALENMSISFSQNLAQLLGRSTQIGALPPSVYTSGRIMDSTSVPAAIHGHPAMHADGFTPTYLYNTTRITNNPMTYEIKDYAAEIKGFEKFSILVTEDMEDAKHSIPREVTPDDRRLFDAVLETSHQAYFKKAYDYITRDPVISPEYMTTLKLVTSSESLSLITELAQDQKTMFKYDPYEGPFNESTVHGAVSQLILIKTQLAHSHVYNRILGYMKDPVLHILADHKIVRVVKLAYLTAVAHGEIQAGVDGASYMNILNGLYQSKGIGGELQADSIKAMLLASQLLQAKGSSFKDTQFKATSGFIFELDKLANLGKPKQAQVSTRIGTKRQVR